MPILNDINHEQRCIYTTCSGLMAAQDFDEYMARIWTDSSNYGYNELFDTTQADWSDFDFNYLFEIAQQAAKLTAIDHNSKLAWHVTEGKDKALTDFYITAKSLITTESRSLEAFYDRQEALCWLGVKS